MLINFSFYEILTFIGIAVLLSLFIKIVRKYRQKEHAYFKNIEELKAFHVDALFQSQMEIKEQTFQSISREIHDNIGQKLTLAKLQLNTVNYANTAKATSQVNDSIIIIGEAINGLSDISRSMSNEIILSNGLIKALEFEAAQLTKSGRYMVSFSATGSLVFMNSNTELMLFRIAQEALNNIIKHAEANMINVCLHYDTLLLSMEITDNGKGFYAGKTSHGTGLKNMKQRALMLKGTIAIASKVNAGTQIKIKIPVHESNTAI